MSALGLRIIDEAVQSANIWINDTDYRTGWNDKQRSYRLLRSVLHVIRDHLSVGEAADLGAQLPTLIRGVYYEGWRPANNPVKMRAAADFTVRVQEAFKPDPLDNAIHAIGAVIDVLDSHVTEGEMTDVKGSFSARIRELFDA